MPARVYRSNSPTESACILNAEWSRHHVAIGRGDDWRLRFSIRPITPQVSLSTLAYGARATVRPDERADVLLLQMPRLGTGLVSHSGSGSAPMDRDHFALVDVRRVAQVQCSAELDVLVLRIDRARLMACLQTHLHRKPEHDLVFDPVMARGSRAWMAWAPIGAALDALQRSPLDDFPVATLQALEEMAVSTLLLAQPNTYSDALSRPVPPIAPRHVRKAEAFVQANLHRPLPTLEIARHAEVSIRALFDGFRAFRHKTPAAYVREARLDRVREDLLRGTDSIAAVAQRLGLLAFRPFRRAVPPSVRRDARRDPAARIVPALKKAAAS